MDKGFPQDYYEKVIHLCEQLKNPNVDPCLAERLKKELETILSERISYIKK